jgi:TonB family protein
VAAAQEPKAPRPKLVCDSPPEYPAVALRAEATGVTRLELQAAPDGQVLEARLVRPSGDTLAHAALDQAVEATG